VQQGPVIVDYMDDPLFTHEHCSPHLLPAGAHSFAGDGDNQTEQYPFWLESAERTARAADLVSWQVTRQTT
jgi:hypothetical protein